MINDTGYEQFFYTFLDNDDITLFSELQIKKELYGFVGVGVTLAYLHSKGYLHGDLHSEHLFFNSKTSSSVFIDCSWIKTEITPYKTFVDFLPLKFTLPKELFIYVLVGYFKTSFAIIDCNHEDYSLDLLNLLGAKPLLKESFGTYTFKNASQNSNIGISINSDTNNFYLEINENSSYSESLLSLFLNYKVSNETLSLDAFNQEFGQKKIQTSELVYIPLIQSVCRNQEFQMNNNELNFTLFKEVFEVIENSYNLIKILGYSLLFELSNLSYRLDCLSLDHKEEIVLYNHLSIASINLAQYSQVIFQHLALNLYDKEILSNTINILHNKLSWFIRPNRRWFAEEILDIELSLSEPPERLKEVLDMINVNNKKLFSVEENPLQIMLYINSLVLSNCHLFEESLKEFKLNRVNNLIWTSIGWAMSYSRRNCIYLIKNLELDYEMNKQALKSIFSSHLKALNLYIDSILLFYSPIVLLSKDHVVHDDIELLIREKTQLIEKLEYILSDGGEYQKSINELITILEATLGLDDYYGSMQSGSIGNGMFKVMRGEKIKLVEQITCLHDPMVVAHWKSRKQENIQENE